MSQDKFMVCLEGCGPEVFATLEEAEDFAHQLMADRRAEAASDGEWSSDTQITIYELKKRYDVAEEAADYAELQL